MSVPAPHRDPLRWANAIVRIAQLRQYAEVSWEQDRISMMFHRTPICNCCAKPLDRQKWSNSVCQGYEAEVAYLAAHG